MNNGLPEGWSIKALGDFNFDISDGNYSNKYPKQSEFCQYGIPFIRANNILNSTIVNNDLRFISKELHAELKKGHLKGGDILISTRGDIGQLALVPKQFIGSNINAQLVRINSGSKLHNRFLLYFLSFDTTQNAIKQLQTGTALKQLPVGKLKEVEITYPPLPEQQKIAKILTSVDEVIEATETQINKLKDLKIGMMNELLTKGIGHTEFKDSAVGRIPVGWEVKSIQFFLNQYKGGAAFKPSDFSKTGFPVIPKKGIQHGGKLIIDKETFCLNSFAENNKSHCVNETYLITTLRDLVPSGPSIGLIVSIEKKKEFILAQGVYGFLLNTGLEPDFLVQLSNTDWYRREMRKIFVGSTQVHIRTQEFFDVNIPIPPLQEQQKIAKILSSTDTNIEQKQSKLTQSKNLKKSLMSDLLTGRVRVTVS